MQEVNSSLLIAIIHSKKKKRLFRVFSIELKSNLQLKTYFYKKQKKKDSSNTGLVSNKTKNSSKIQFFFLYYSSVNPETLIIIIMVKPSGNWQTSVSQFWKKQN
jgi:hypothetical protein